MNGFWRYEAMEEIQYRPEVGRYRTYGIRAIRRTAQGWEQLELLHDVTISGQFAENLARLFDKYQLSPLQLREVMEDVLS